MGVAITSTEVSWYVLGLHLLLVDTWWAHSSTDSSLALLGHSILSTSVSSTGLSISPDLSLVATGIGVAMQGVGVYAHVYMGYEYY